METIAVSNALILFLDAEELTLADDEGEAAYKTGA